MIPLAGAFRDAVVLMLPQVPDNAVNGRLGLASRVKTFMLFCQIHFGTKSTGKFNSNQFTTLKVIMKIKLHKNFHEMFGLSLRL